MKKLAYTLIILFQFLAVAWADSFVVKNIQVQGLQRVSAATVESYLPVHRGQVMQPAKSAAILRALYKTGFFDQVTLSREGNTLIIHVVERPTIGKLKIKGNSVIQTDKLKTVMQSLDVAEGRVYNPAILEKIKQSLLNQYYMLGRYNARVDINTSPMPRNRIEVNIDISEGLVAKVKSITIIGNKVFDESTLVKQMDMTTSGITTFLTMSDRYSEEKLESSVEKIRGYYLDHGYLRMQVKSSQAQVTPDRKAVYVTIVLEEGLPYTVKGIEIQGKLPVPREEIEQQIHVKAGQVFSRQKIMDSEKDVSKLLGSNGYMLANITLHPQVNDQKREVVLVFQIDAGKRVYVRHVTFSENNKTNDEVLRREVMQWESSPASTTKMEESKTRLSLLPFIKDVELSVKPVPEAKDQVDVNYKVKEDSSAQASFKLGYSQLDRIIVGLGFNEKNFFGTGNTLGVNFSHSKYEQFFGVDYTNPYYTEDGISRTVSMAISRMNPGNVGITSSYTTHEYDLGMFFGIPVGQEDAVINRITAGANYQDTVAYLTSSISNQINSFVAQHGRHFQELDLKLAYTRDSRDKAIFPTSGTLQTLALDGFAPMSASSVSFYQMAYSAKWYQPLYKEFIILSRADLAYGNGLRGPHEYPFFRNFYAGGISSVRGYQGYSLGPTDSNGKPFGGNKLVDASIGLIFPNYLSDNLRTSAFVDGGNVYSILDNRSYGCTGTTCSTNAGPIRYSAGIEADWLTPFGPIELSLAKTLNRRPGDAGEPFQFALGANF